MNTFSYKGNMHPFAAVLCHSSDSGTAMPVLEKLSQAGQRLYLMNETNISEKILNKACCVIVFLSGNYYGSEALLNAYLKAGKLSKSIISIRADGEPMPEVLSNYSYSKNSLNKSKYDDDALVQRILSANELKNPKTTPAQKGAYKKTLAGLIAAVLAVAAVIIFGTIRTGSTEPETVTEPEPVPDFLSELGITEEDLAEVRAFVLAGDYVAYSDSVGEPEDYVSNCWNDELQRDEYVLLETGEKVEMGGPDDLSFLTRFPNLERLILINQNAETLPDLSSLENLLKITVYGSEIKDLEGLRNCQQLKYVHIDSDVISDLSPLNDCPKLSEIYIWDGGNIKNLDGLNFSGLETFDISSSTLEDISALASWESLSSLKIETRPGCPAFDLSPLSGCGNLKELVLDTLNSGKSADLSFVSALTKLESLDVLAETIDGGLDGIENCSCLQSLRIEVGAGPQWLDLDCLGTLTSLDIISLNNINCSLDFLTKRAETQPQLKELTVSGNNLDLSGIGSLKSIEKLEISAEGNFDSDLFAQFKDTSIRILYLNSFGDGHGNVDLSEIPGSVTELGIDAMDFDDLGQLSCRKLTKLYFGYNNAIRSLSGIEELTELEELDIWDCYCLMDFDSLYSLKEIRHIRLCRQFVLPDYSRMQFSDDYGVYIALEEIPEMKDLSCLDVLPDEIAGSGKCEIVVKGPEVENLNALYRFKGSKLTVSDRLAVQAIDLIENECFRELEIDYSDDWAEINPDIRVESLEELETMPKALLKYITYLCIAGDEVLDDGWQISTDDRTGEIDVYASRYDDDSMTEAVVQASQPLDVELISQLTGLETLVLAKQNIESLDSLQNLEQLTELDIIYCEVEDISPIFAIDTLEVLCLRGDNITSIDGIQNLRNLRSLTLDYAEISDISPLEKMQFSDEVIEEGFDLALPLPWLRENYPTDLSALAAVSKYLRLDLNNYNSSNGVEDWVPYLAGKEIVAAYLFGSFDSNEQLAAFAESVGSVEELQICYNSALTDLTCLINMNGLQRVVVTQEDMADAIASLENLDIPFELIIE